MRIKWKMAGFRGSRPFLDKECNKEEKRALPPVVCKAAKVYLTGFIAAAFFVLSPAKTVCAEPVKIVIDPGHGGDNLGGQYGGNTEKYMTMVVAEAMKEELEKYEGVEVYLTRTEDVDMTLQQRADYAKEVDADFLFCLHFNMSERHTLYGSEVWVSAFGKCYAAGKSFGELCLDELCAQDLYRRGVKTRLNKDGTDYYGIIQHCEEYGIPSAIIEHCHIDHREDKGHYETTEAMKRLGEADATAVAKYYGLRSSTLDVDYRNYEKSKVEVPATVMKPDSTAPVDVSATCLRVKEDTGEVNILLTGEDPESGLLYYDYSLNGGASYSALQKWEGDSSTLECTLKVPTDQDIALKCRVYNGYDLDTETEVLEIPALQGGSGSAGNMPQETESSGQETDPFGQGTDTLEQGANTLPGNAGDMSQMEEEETSVSSGNPHQIDMEWYERQDAQKNSEKLQINGEDISQFLWLAVLGLLVSILILLMITRAVWQKKQRRAKHRGRRR